tara:strand:- start:4187 stop:4534 length:348 start_codon:yes stop_codon:yes gene_type:complete
MGLTQCLLGLPELGLILLTDVLGAGLEPVFHAALGLIDPALDLRDSEIVLASHFSRRGLALEDVHDHGSLALRGPSFDGVVVAHPVLLMTALYPAQLWRGSLHQVVPPVHVEVIS